MFTQSQIKKYAESIFQNHRFTDKPEQRMACPIHQGKDKNFAFNMDHGVWTCHSRCGSGGMVQLENRLHGGSREEATERLFRQIGMAPLYASKQIVCTYEYVDAAGRLLFQKVRLEPKDFRFRMPAGRNGYTYSAPPLQRPLYGLPGVVTCNILMITEGEKDSDTLNSIAEWPSGTLGRVYATTSGGGDTWRPEHAMYALGKKVFVFEDNDEKGRKFSKTVSESVFPFAQSVRIVRFEDSEEKTDVTKFITTHGLEKFVEKIKNSSLYCPAIAEEESTIVEGMAFAMSGSPETNWLIDNVVQAEGNGIIMGDPKAGKSLSVVDMVVCLISGTPWHDCNVKNRMKVGLVTREDAPGLTKKRIQRLVGGKKLSNFDLDGWLWINSREQTKTFDIRDEIDFSRLVKDFKKQQCRIVFFDVFNRIHRMDENDNTQMAEVTSRLTQFGQEVGCQVALVHHINKDQSNGNIFNRLRGAGALHGWMEWGMAITTVNPEEDKNNWIRRIDFESKEVTTDPVHFRIEDGPGWTRLVKDRYEQPARRRIGVVSEMRGAM